MTIRDRKVRLRWLLICFCVFGVHGIQAADQQGELLTTETEEQIKRLVVMVRGQIRDELTSGAGIVLGSRGDRLYIATANHVVRWGADEAKNIEVELRIVPGEPFPAKLLRFHPGLDLAVLSVRGVRSEAIPLDLIPFNRLGDPSRLTRGEAVYSVGYPRGKPWRINVTPDRVAGSSGDFIRFESNVIAPGYSGGALFDARGRLMGMIRADEPPEGEAVKINRILDRARQWGFPVKLSVMAEEAEPGGPAPEEPKTDAVAELLQECEAHFAAHRLTNPQGNNALECFSEVLDRDRGNRQALTGLQRIAGTYIEWTRSALKRKDLDSAATYLQRLKKVAPDDPQVGEFQSQLMSAKEKTAAAEKAEQKLRQKEAAAAETERTKRREERRKREAEQESPDAAGTAALRGRDGAAIYRQMRKDYQRYASKDLYIKAPEIAENGAVVPVTLEAKSKVPGRFWLFVEPNDNPVTANFRYHTPVDNFKFSLRVKMCRTGDLFGVFVPDQGEAMAARKRVDVTTSSGCRPGSGDGPAVSGNDARAIKARAKNGTFKLLFLSPMTRQAYISTVDISGDGRPVATLSASPMVSKNPYLSGSYPKSVRRLTIEAKGSDGTAATHTEENL